MTAKYTGDLWENPLGTDGFEFVEYASPHAEDLAQLFTRLGFSAVARHRSKKVTLFRQGDINFILNAEPNSQAERFTTIHGPSANAIAFRVRDAAQALHALVAGGAPPVESGAGPMELRIPAIEGIGGSLIYLVDRYGDQTIYDVDFRPLAGVDQHPQGVGLTYVDHLTHNVERGNMEKWAAFYERHFHFKELRYFDIEGKLTGLRSRAMTSPCGKIRIPINESADDRARSRNTSRITMAKAFSTLRLALMTFIAPSRPYGPTVSNLWILPTPIMTCCPTGYLSTTKA